MVQQIQTAPLDNIVKIGTQKPIPYNREVKTAMLGDTEIRVEHLTPVLSPEEREIRKREIENRLFEVFVKYVEVDSQR